MFYSKRCYEQPGERDKKRASQMEGEKKSVRASEWNGKLVKSNYNMTWKKCVEKLTEMAKFGEGDLMQNEKTKKQWNLKTGENGVERRIFLEREGFYCFCFGRGEKVNGKK